MGYALIAICRNCGRWHWLNLGRLGLFSLYFQRLIDPPRSASQPASHSAVVTAGLAGVRSIRPRPFYSRLLGSVVTVNKGWQLRVRPTRRSRDWWEKVADRMKRCCAAYVGTVVHC